jgi:alcohol dehydrogenase
MLGLVHDGNSTRLRRDLPRPARAAGEATIRPRLAGICNTDLEIARGYMGFRGVLGHEFVGEVIACDDAAWLGARVVGGINCGCGHCSRCARGEQNHCGARSVLGILGRDGVLAEEFTLPLRNLLRVPDSVPDRAAVFTEPLAAAFRIVEQVAIGSGDSVAVLGGGKLGSLCVRVLARIAGRVAVFTRRRGRGVLPPNVSEYPAEDAAAAQNRGAFRVVVEATGNEAALATALHLVEPRGVVVLKTTCQPPHSLGLAPVVIDEVTIIGSRCGPFAPALAALGDRHFEVDSLIDSTFPLERCDEALVRAGERGVLKVLVEGGRIP